MIRNLRELHQYRALLWSLTLRELKARYRGSVLGFFWTFLNPTLLMLVYALVFSVYMRQRIPFYPYFMFIGLLPWVWFSTSVGAGASTISDRRDLLTKVRFPAQVLPATVVLTTLCNFLLSVPLVLGLGVAYGLYPSVHAIAFPLVVAVQLLFTLALAYIISALNVFFRDLQHIIGNFLTLWFFVTPVLYMPTTIPERFRALAIWLNPMAILVTSYQAILYEHRWPDPAPLGALAAFAGLLMWGASEVFERRREEFAELI
jgi:lipopolysaccharide transport system permease protein